MLLKDIQGWLSTYFRRKGCAQHIWHWSTEQGQILRREVLYMWWKWKLCEKFISLELSPLGSLSHWLVSWASMGIDPHEVCWAMASGLTGPGNLEQLPLVLVLVFDHRTPGTFQISINWGAFVKSYSWFLLSLSLSLPLPPFPPLCLFPSSEGWHFFLESFVFLWSISFPSKVYSVCLLAISFTTQGLLEVRVFWGILIFEASGVVYA